MVDFPTELADGNLTQFLAEGSTFDTKLDSELVKLVGFLRERNPNGVNRLLAEITEARNRSIADQMPQVSAAILARYDQLLSAVLARRYDALDAALHHTDFPIAEIDGEGIVSYTNEALKALLPDALGRNFAELFGPRRDDVSRALSSGGRVSLRLDLKKRNGPFLNLRGEIGPLYDEHGRLGSYALLLSLEGEAARFDALPDGILRLDFEGNVVYANRRAQRLFNGYQNKLLGRSAFNLFARRGPGLGEEGRIDLWRASADGFKELTEAHPLDNSLPVAVRLTIVPSFDSTDNRSGWIVTIVTVADELAKTEIQRLLSMPDNEPEALVQGIMLAIKRVIPYDLATFGVYTNEMTQHNTLVIYPMPEWEWSTAWFPLGLGVRQFLMSDRTWGSNISEATKLLAPDTVDHDVVHHIVKNKLSGFVTLPIGGGGQEIRASLTLMSRVPEQYDGSEIERMRDLGVESALIVAESNIVRRYEDRIRAAELAIYNAEDNAELARALVKGISDCFGWDYVAVFRVERSLKKFHLMGQCNRTNFSDVDENYSQGVSEGLLGASYLAKELLIEDNLEAKSDHNYKLVVPGRRSALAMPIRIQKQARNILADEIEWMLAVESSQRNAFQGPAMEALEDIVEQCEGILKARWQNSIQRSLLDAVEQAVIITNALGEIQLTNTWANTLLRQDSRSLYGMSLSNFGDTPADREIISLGRRSEQARLTLSITGGIFVPTLATCRAIGDDYGHQLWLFTDLREHEQQSDWGYLEKTVNEVAQNARVPIMLASSLILDAAKSLAATKIATGPIGEALVNAARQLGKADITYERLASTLAVRREPDRAPQVFDPIDTLRQALANLPDDDIVCCDLDDIVKDYQPRSLSGWPEQLGFVFRSLLAHLLLKRPPNSKIKVGIETENDVITFALSVNSAVALVSSASDRIGIAEDRAKDATSLASEAIELAVHRHDGTFCTSDAGDAKLEYRIVLRCGPQFPKVLETA